MKEDPKWSLVDSLFDEYAFIKLLILKIGEKFQTPHCVWYVVIYTFSLKGKFPNVFFLQLLNGLFKHNEMVIGIIDLLHSDLGYFNQTATSTP